MSGKTSSNKEVWLISDNPEKWDDCEPTFMKWPDRKSAIDQARELQAQDGLDAPVYYVGRKRAPMPIGETFDIFRFIELDIPCHDDWKVDEWYSPQIEDDKHVDSITIEIQEAITKIIHKHIGEPNFFFIEDVVELRPVNEEDGT